MNRHLRSVLPALCCVLLGSSMLVPVRASAHCDGLDGPVVNAARRALETGDEKPVLVWVQERDGAEIKRALSRTLAVRRLGSEAKELADLYFFETVVRLHRAGEGAPYTGLKPAGRDLGPAIPAADRALETSDHRALSDLLAGAMRDGLAPRFHEAVEARRHAGESVEAGRRYVSAYVKFIHYVEGLYQSAAAVAPVHSEDAAKEPAHPH